MLREYRFGDSFRHMLWDGQPERYFLTVVMLVARSIELRVLKNRLSWGSK
jgi:hypothetical protein